MKRFLSMLLAVLFFSGVAEASPTVKVSVYGDSTIAGYLPDGTYTPNSTSVVMERELQKQFGSVVTVSSKANVGATIKDLILGQGLFTETLAQMLTHDDGNIIIENFAINDSWMYPATDYEQRLTQFITIVRAAGKIPVLEEPNPICNPYRANWGAMVASTVPIINRVGAQNNVLVIKQYDYITLMPNWQSMLNGCVHPNGVHPNEALYTIKGIAQKNAIAPLVQSMLGQ